MMEEQVRLVAPAPALSEAPIVLYGYRWVILAMYFWLVVANSGVFITFGPIDTTTSGCFDQSLLAVNGMTGMSAIAAILLLFPSIWVLKRIGTRKAVLVTALCQALCGAIRILFSLLPVSRGVYFWAIFASQFFGALPNALLAALPAEISAHWFGEHERSVATAIGTLAQLVGIGSGQAFSGYYIGSSGIGGGGGNVTAAVLASVTPSSDVCGNFKWMFISQGIFCLLAAAPTLFFREHPPSPPSYTRSMESHLKAMSLWEEIKHCLAIRAFLLIMLVFAAGMGTFLTLWSVMQQLVGTVYEATTISVIMVGCGIVGAGLTAVITDKYRNYKTVLIFSAPGGLSGLVLFFLGLYKGIDALVYTGGALGGFFMIALTPVVFETAAEITYPVEEVTSTALLLIFGNVDSIVFLVLFSTIDALLSVLLAMMCVYAATLFVFPFFRPVYKRLNIEKERDSALTVNQ